MEQGHSVAPRKVLRDLFMADVVSSIEHHKVLSFSWQMGDTVFGEQFCMGKFIEGLFYMED